MTERPAKSRDILEELKVAVVSMAECRSKMMEARASEVLIESLAQSSISNVRDAELPEIARLEDPDYKEMSRLYLSRQELMRQCFDRAENAAGVLHRAAIRYKGIDCGAALKLYTNDVASITNRIELLLECLKTAASHIETTEFRGVNERVIRRRPPARNPKNDAIRLRAKKLLDQNTVDGTPPSVLELCRLLDAKGVPLPTNVIWKGEGFWTGAYKNEQYRQSVRLWVNRLR